jgi:hypothetical protein
MKFDKTPKIPFHQDYKSIITATKPFLQENKLSKEYKGFRKFIAAKHASFDYQKVKSERNFYDKMIIIGSNFLQVFVLRFMWLGILSL